MNEYSLMLENLIGKWNVILVSRILNTGLERSTLLAAIDCIELGANPVTLGLVQEISKSLNMVIQTRFFLHVVPNFFIKLQVVALTRYYFQSAIYYKQ